MQSGKLLLFILLVIGAVFMCGCDEPSSGATTSVTCNYNAATAKWDCSMVFTKYWADDSGTHISDKYSSYSTNYCSPLDGPYIVRTCEGDEYAPPSPSPSPSPPPLIPSGPTYKISEMTSGGGRGGGITPTFP
ncbi:MAG: hypothetical protein JXA44_07150 [Methanospirillaceae archaeon]|nr:hypothetical protein [Methanospirillaceae archaeon]